MLIYAIKISIYLPEAQSLKEKRKVRNSLVDRLGQRNLSIMESGRQEEHQHLELLLSYVSLGEEQAKKKRELILELVNAFSEHVQVEEDVLFVEE